MDMADWKGPALRRVLASADFFRDSAMRRALRCLNIPLFKSRASLRFATAADHLRGECAVRDLDLAAMRQARMAPCQQSVGANPRILQDLSVKFLLSYVLIGRAAISRCSGLS
jgi:hypothetical protein